MLRKYRDDQEKDAPVLDGMRDAGQEDVDECASRVYVEVVEGFADLRKSKDAFRRHRVVQARY